MRNLTRHCQHHRRRFHSIRFRQVEKINSCTRDSTWERHAAEMRERDGGRNAGSGRSIHGKKDDDEEEETEKMLQKSEAVQGRKVILLTTHYNNEQREEKKQRR